jgi:hypothetical protein
VLLRLLLPVLLLRLLLVKVGRVGTTLGFRPVGLRHTLLLLLVLFGRLSSML